MRGEITVQVNVVIGKEPVNAAVLAEVRPRRGVFAGGAFPARNNACHKLVAEFHGFSGGIGFDVLAEFDDLAGPLVSENDRTQSERIALVFMAVGSADAAAFHLDENLVVVDFRNWVFSEFKFTGFYEIREFCHFCHFCSPVR